MTMGAMSVSNPGDALAGLRLAIHDFFVTHQRAPSRDELADACGWAYVDVVNGCEALEREHVIVLDRWTRELRMAMPFSAVPTGYRTAIGARSWWANCAWDALGIAAMLGGDAAIRARCPGTGAPVTLAVQGGEVAGAGEVAGEELVVHFLLPARDWWHEIELT
jgi:hypothetical protein